MILPNPSMDFTPFDILTAEEMDQIVENIEHIASNGAVDSNSLATGVPVQLVGTNYSGVATGTTAIPFDDTIPQSSEGTEFMTQTITPKSATNRLQITAVIMVSASAASRLVAALFQDSTGNALAGMGQFVSSGSADTPMILRHNMIAGTTSATTFKIRAGLDGSGTITFNGESGARRLGGITLSSISIMEYKA